MRDRSRRRFLRLTGAALGVSALVGAAGCTQDDDPSGEGDRGASTPTPASTPTRASTPTERATPNSSSDGATVDESGRPSGTTASDASSAMGTPTRRPAADGDSFYVVTDSPSRYAIAADPGDVRWDVTGSASSGAAPVATEGTVVFVEDGTLVGVSAGGEERWTESSAAAVRGLVADGDRVVVATESAVAALSVGDGERIWRTPVDGAVSTAPAVGEDTVAVGLDGGDVLALAADSGDERWREPTNGDTAVAPAVGHGRVVGATTSLVRAFDARSGSQVWNLDPTFAVGAPPLVAPDAVYVGTVADYESGASGQLTPPPTDVARHDVRVRRLGPADATEQWKWRETWTANYTDPGPWEPPSGLALAATSDHAILLAADELVALDGSLGLVAWRWDASGVSPAVTDGVVSDGLVGVRVADGDVRWDLRSA